MSHGLLAQASLRDQLFSWTWVSQRWDEVWEATIEHLQLTFVAVAIGLAIAVVLSAISLAWRPAYGPITWVTGLMYTIPSVALFGILIPITGLGFATAEIALVSYTLLILIRNVVAGVDGVPSAIKEAADGMGYSTARRFVSVDLRLATPTIIAGIRIATVTVVGLVTITSLVGEGGYGVFILDGLRRDFPTPIILGTVLSLILALVLDLALILLERAITPWTRRGSAH